MNNRKAIILSNGDNRENLIGRECVIVKTFNDGVNVYTSYYSDLFPFGANYFYLPHSAIKIIE